MEEYLRTCYRPDREYLEGMILERNVGQYSHARVQGKIFGACQFNEEAWAIRAVPEQRVQVKRERFRVPDIVLLRADAPREEIVTTPPLVCVEVLSEDDRMSEMQERIADYLEMGVPWVWLVDPRKRTAWIYSTSGSAQVRDGMLRVPGTRIEVSMADAFAD